MGRIEALRWPAALATVLAALAVTARPARADWVETLQATGKSEDRVDLVILAEAYPASEEARFRRDCTNLIAALREKPPFDRYLSFVNIHAVYRPAERSGIPRTEGEWRTLYGTRFTGGGRLVTGDLARIQAAAAAAAPDVDRIIVLIHEQSLAGAAYGITSLFTTAFAYNGSMFLDVAIHELGHIFGNLADEYGGDPEIVGEPATNVPEELERLFAANPNVTPWGRDRARIPWRVWIPEDTRVPAGFFTQGISAFEGAAYRDEGMFRPARSCGMRDNSSPFCEVCREAILLYLYRASHPTQISLALLGTAEVTIETVVPEATRNVTQERSGTRLVVVVLDRTDWTRVADRSPLRTEAVFTVPPETGEVRVRVAAPSVGPPATTPGITGVLDRQ